MSIKEGFDSNNIDLQTAIELANSLPVKGSGAVELETVTITVSSYTSHTFHYVNANGEYVTTPAIVEGGQVVMLKNTICYTKADAANNDSSISDGTNPVTVLYEAGSYGVFLADADATILYDTTEPL